MATTATKNGQSFEEFCQETFNPKKEFTKPEALKGYRVLSCTQYILGPSCASYLAELGRRGDQDRSPAARRSDAPHHPLQRALPLSSFPLGSGARDGLGVCGCEPERVLHVRSISIAPRRKRFSRSWPPSRTCSSRTIVRAPLTAGASDTGSSKKSIPGWCTAGWAVSGAGDRGGCAPPTTSWASRRAATSA